MARFARKDPFFLIETSALVKKISKLNENKAYLLHKAYEPTSFFDAELETKIE